MSAQQQIVGAAGIGLVVANAWTGQQHKDLAALLSGGKDVDKAHAAAKQVGVELLGVGVLVLLAGAGRSAGNAAAAVIVALWVLWLIKRNPSAVANGATAAAHFTPRTA